MEEAYQLTQALPGVGWIEQPVQLGHGGAEAARKFAAAEPGPVHPSPRLHGELVDQEFGEVARVLVVLEGVVDVYGTLVPGFEELPSLWNQSQDLGGVMGIQVRERQRSPRPATAS